MTGAGTAACVLGGAAALVLGGAYACYRLAFGVDRRRSLLARDLPRGEQYEPLHGRMLSLIDDAERRRGEDVWMENREGLRLHARYYEAAPGAPLQILFHGYRSSAIRDFCGGLGRELDRGWNVLLVDQRAHGRSGGRCLSFGVMERLDCLDWVEWARGRFGAQTPIVLVGISMGAATVLMAAGLELPENVRGILADCGYTSPSDIIRSVMASMHCPRAIYPLLRLGGRLYGGFDIDSAGAEEALRRCRVPVLFVHGEDDRFVPCDMSRRNWAACASEKTLLTVPGAGHGLSYLVDEPGYEAALEEFLERLHLPARVNG